MKLPIRIKIFPDGVAPRYSREGDAGLDLHAAGSVVLDPGEICAVPCGFAIEIPEGYEGNIRSRSGHFVRGIHVEGTVDSNYRGPIKAIVHNLSAGRFRIERGDRIAQMVIAPVVQAEIVTIPEGEELSATNRGAAGFGSSGDKPIEERSDGAHREVVE